MGRGEFDFLREGSIEGILCIQRKLSQMDSPVWIPGPIGLVRLSPVYKVARGFFFKAGGIDLLGCHGRD
jgi:hypothetical protein